MGKQGNIRLGFKTTTYPEAHGEGFCIISNGKPILDPETGSVLELPTKKDVAVYGLSVLKKKVSLYLAVTEFLPSSVEKEADDGPLILG